MGHKARNRKKYQQRIKTSIHAINNGEGVSGHLTSNFGLGATTRTYTSVIDPSLSPNIVMQPMPGPMPGPSCVTPHMIRPLFQLRPQDRRPLMGLGPIGGGLDGLGVGPPMGYPSGLPDYHPPIHDPTEFPSLTSLNLSLNEVGAGNQFQLEPNPFDMSSEDFPALPGASALHSSAARNKATMPKAPLSSSQPSDSTDQRNAPTPEKTATKSRIVTSSDGMVTNIPNSMMNDQFGMVGLLARFKIAETNPDLVSLALGTDLTDLGLNLNANDPLYPSFGGPWAEGPVRAEDLEWEVPQEYKISERLKPGPTFDMREKLAPVRLSRYGEDLLFYLFYSFCGDILQMLAAAELYNRDWRYHKIEKIWITRIPGVQVIEKTNKFERGTYYFFHPISWTKIAKELFIEYDKLEGRPVDPHAPHSSNV